MKTHNNRPQRIGEILLADGTITQAQLDIALQEQQARRSTLGLVPLPLGEVLVRNRFCTRAQVEAAMVKTVAGNVAGMFQRMLPQEVCRSLLVLPERVEGSALCVKAAVPLTQAQKKLLMSRCAYPVSDVRVRAISRGEFKREAAKLFEDKLVLSEVLDRLKRNDITATLVQEAVTALLKEALNARASDISLDYKSDVDSWISWRIDGTVQRKFLLPRRAMGPLFIRLKSEAGMDASENRRSQDGRITLRYGGRGMDFRVSTLPIVGGESVTLRVLDGESQPELDEMFPFQAELLEQLEAYLMVREKRGGLILVSGQTGSGKSTTNNAMARRLPRERCNLVTVEDPVELELPHARQYQPNALLKQRMSEVERTLLRQDPDVIYVGEIRDADSAVMALKMVESGHLVLTTVHAESPTQALLRVVSMASESESGSREWAAFVISQFLKVSLNQSLWARVCPRCATPAATADEAGDGEEGPGVYLNRMGCAHCNLGRKGRVLVHDSLLLTRAVSDIERNALQNALRSGNAQELQAVQAMTGFTRITREAVVRNFVKHKLLALDDLQEFEQDEEVAHA